MSDKSFHDSFKKDPRTKRISHYGTQSQTRRSQSTDSDSGRGKRHDAEDDDSDTDQYNYDKLKKFHIPRKKGREEKELLTEMSLEAREYTHTIYPTFRSSLFDPQASRKIIINKVELVQNQKLEKEYLAKKKDMKDEGRSEKDVTDSFGYLHFFKKSEVEKVCRDGVSTGHCNLSSLGKPEMGVYICKHSDIVRYSKWEDGITGYIVMFKVMKGKTKVVTENRTPITEQEPTPLYDSHITKVPIDVAQSIHSRAYLGFQYYFYEYGDIDVVKRPRQVLPYAVLKYTYGDIPSAVIAGSVTSRRDSSIDDVFPDSGMTSPTVAPCSENGFCHWRGKLLVKNGTFCSVEIRSHLDTVFNVANIDRGINIKTCLSLDKLKRQLPPTLMSRTAKKYNVIYRGRHYNTFTLHPTEDGSGLGKFRQLISLLVQKSSAAYIPLRNNSIMYLLPLSYLTAEMGLRGSPRDITSPDSSKQSARAWKNFLHVIIITPKMLSSKINDQRVFNVVHARKRKESNPSTPMSSVRDALEQKLRLMNIDPSSALSSMDPDQYQKILDQLKNKKRIQTSEKMLHLHYKEMDAVPSSLKYTWIKNVATLWTGVAKQQQDFYSGKKKLKVIPSPSHSRRGSSKSSDGVVEPVVEDQTEATFSDDEDSGRPTNSHHLAKQPRIDDLPREPRRSSGEAEVPPLNRADPRAHPSKRANLPLPYTPASRTPTASTVAGASPSVLRPSFKPLEELIFCGKLEELLKHPEFNFSDSHCLSHKVMGFVSPDFSSWDENQPPIQISFTQTVPYKFPIGDCPFAFEKDPIVLSMLRAIHGDYNDADDTPEEYGKVEWVRNILHSRSLPTENVDSASSSYPSSDSSRKIEQTQKASPQFTEVSPHQSSTDSGFVSSSSAATPGNLTVPDSPSLKEIAALIASALTQSKPEASGTTPKQPAETSDKKAESNNPEMELAAKALLEVLTHSQTVEEEVEDGAGEDNMDGMDMELGSTPDQSPAKISVESETFIHGTDQSGKQTTAATKPMTNSSNSQGTMKVAKDPSLLRRSRPALRMKVKIPREEETLAALRKIVPGLTKTALCKAIMKAAPLIAKLKKKLGKQNPPTHLNTTVANQTTGTLQEEVATKESQTSKKLDKLDGKMTITIMTKKDTEEEKARSQGMKKNETSTTDIPDPNLLVKKSIGNLLMTEKVGNNSEIPSTIGRVGKEQSKANENNVLKGTTGGQLAYSATTQKKVTSAKNFMTTDPNPTSLIGAPYSAIVPTMANIGNTVAGNVIHMLPNEGLSSGIPSVTAIGSLTTPTLYPSMYQGQGPFCPTQTPIGHHPYSATIRAPHVLAYRPTGLNAGGGNPGFLSHTYPVDTISAQNTELLNSIISLMNREQSDPRRKRPEVLGQQYNKSLSDVPLQPSEIAKLIPQINALLLQVSTQPTSSQGQPVSTTSESIKPGNLPSATSESKLKQANSSSGSLSSEDIRRIREKKERMRAKRLNEKELCKREAMHMREELNKMLDSKTKQTSKKSKSQPIGTNKANESPAGSSTSGASVEGHDGRNPKPPDSGTPSKSDHLFSLDKAASSKVLHDVAIALSASPSLETTTNSATALMRPTGVVTPSPRPVHPIFMESRTAFPLTETSTQQNVTPTEAESSNDKSKVISEIDATLSILKQGMQADQHNADLKDSMSKLLQLVIKLGGPQNPSISTVADSVTASRQASFATTSPFTTTNDALQVISPVSEESTGLILSAASLPKDTIPFISDEFAYKEPERVHSPENAGNEINQPEVTESSTTDQSKEPPSSSTKSTDMKSHNIDELLSKIRPAIENLNKMQSRNVTDSSITAPKRHHERNSRTEKRSYYNWEGYHEGADNEKKSRRKEHNPKANNMDRKHSPTNFTTLPCTRVDVVRPQPATQPDNIQPILSIAKNLPPVAVTALEQEPIISCGLTEDPNMFQQSHIEAMPSPVAKSDRGTPTLDERYPDPIPSQKDKRKGESRSNSFFVYNPEGSIECEAMQAYLKSVKGVQVNIVKIVEDFLQSIRSLDWQSISTDVLHKQYCEFLPKGTLWIVFRTDDIPKLHLVPHLALLKAAGSNIQFVSANSVRDVRLRQYKNILNGDGGIVLPLCPKTLLTKPVAFRHLMMWLVGQNTDSRKGRNKWRIALHQHILNALQEAQGSTDIIIQQNAQQVSEWLCHASNSKSKLALELPEHQCDVSTATKTPDAWNWYDTATDELLVKSSFQCALKLQLDRVKQWRHIVLLIDGEPGNICWQPLWRSGICVSTMERFVELVCTEHSESRMQSTSCVLPLCGAGLTAL